MLLVTTSELCWCYPPSLCNIIILYIVCMCIRVEENKAFLPKLPLHAILFCIYGWKNGKKIWGRWDHFWICIFGHFGILNPIFWKNVKITQIQLLIALSCREFSAEQTYNWTFFANFDILEDIRITDIGRNMELAGDVSISKTTNRYHIEFYVIFTISST